MDAIQHPALRDLIWAVTSPSLLAPLPHWPGSFDPALTTNDQQRLLNTCTAALDAHLAARETRFLGSYFEALWEFFFLQQPRFDVIAKNLQIRDGNKTLGELDFVVFDQQTNTHLHLELAIKFYLGIKEPNDFPYTDGEHLWVGPQARDRLDLKVSRTLEHQLKLSAHPLTRARLETYGVNTVEPKFLVKGYLFQPSTVLPLPEYVNSTTGHAGWLKVSELPHLLDACDDPHRYAWHVLQKRHWPAPPYPENLLAALSGEALLDEVQSLLARENRPYMIVMTHRAQAGRSVHKRYFVTPDDWPDRHR